MKRRSAQFILFFYFPPKSVFPRPQSKSKPSVWNLALGHWTPGTRGCRSTLTTPVKAAALSKSKCWHWASSGFQGLEGKNDFLEDTRHPLNNGCPGERLIRQGKNAIMLPALTGQTRGARAGLSAPAGGCTARLKVRDFSTKSDTGLHPCAADMASGARTFPHCLFDRRPRTLETQHKQIRGCERFFWKSLQEKRYL